MGDLLPPGYLIADEWSGLYGQALAAFQSPSGVLKTDAVEVMQAVTALRLAEARLAAQERIMEAARSIPDRYDKARLTRGVVERNLLWQQIDALRDALAAVDATPTPPTTEENP